MDDLYIGIDVGKSSHTAAFLSTSLLARHKRYESCPTVKIEQSRTGFELLLKELVKYASPERCHVVLEKTGHYGASLEQYLQEQGIQLYRMQAKKRYGHDKTDKQDSQALAVMLYTQVGLQAPVVDDSDAVVPLVAASDAARTLRGLVRHRYELQHECVQRKNKLTAICDELFPELPMVYTDPNSGSALALRSKYPLPGDVLIAPIDMLCKTRLRTYPARELLIQLQALASTSVGTKDVSRQVSLQYEQQQLIEELQLLNKHVEKLDTLIEKIVETSREGQILASFTGVGNVAAATLLSGIGSIANFESASKLRGYLGWAPKRSQTGTTMDSTSLAKSGNALLKQTMYLVTMTAIRYDPTWKALYTRLVERKCAYDGRTKKHKGKMKVIGRIAGQMIGLMYRLLKRDYDLLQSVRAGEQPPAPELYDPAKHCFGIH